MNFKTTFEDFQTKLKINYDDDLFFLGSCFGQNISSILKSRKFKIYSNPFGIVYNPISISENILDVLNKKEYSKSELIFNNEIFSCFNFHSDLSGVNADNVVKKINSKIEKSNEMLSKTNILFLTLGTAWVYEHKSKIVANCHKLTKQNFRKRLLSIDEVVIKFTKVISRLHELNKEMQIVFTISPVRHLRDGFIENNQSKSILNLAIMQILETNINTHYFPAYEYVIDDLRDYRFFKEDMVHPSQMAVDYVLEKFALAYFESETLQNIKEIENIKKSLNHKVLFKETETSEKFIASVFKKIDIMEQKGFDFSIEKDDYLLN